MRIRAAGDEQVVECDAHAPSAYPRTASRAARSLVTHLVLCEAARARLTNPAALIAEARAGHV